MIDPTRDQLLGYLLGALEEDEQLLVERQLEHDARLRRELAVLSRGLAPLDAAWRDYSPPPDLAVRTCRFVRSQRDCPTTSSRPKPRVAAMRPECRAGGPSGSWRFQDMLTVAGMVLAASILILPALYGSRVQARLLTCQNNLRELGVALMGYSERNNGFFPRVPTRGKLAAASVFGPILAQSQCLPDAGVLVCPDSRLAENRQFAIPTLAQVEATQSDEELKQLQETMGGSYGYTLGFEKNGTYYPTRNLRRANFAVASDAPSPWLPNHQSENHDRHGQNVLFEDGHVRFLASPRPNDRIDDLFQNDEGLVAAGTHQNDSVIGGGATPPIRYVRGD
jgi:hypothetical protein